DPIPAGGVRSLTYQVMVTPRAAEGVIHTNTAQGFADGDGDGRFGRACAPGEDPLTDGCDLAVTPVARAGVLVTPGVFSPRAHVVGKVFLDVDGDGRQSAGEPGIGGVRIVTGRGHVVTTDEEGMYHLAGLPPGRHVLRLDERTLPSGLRAGGGTVRLLDAPLGGLYTVNFAVRGE